jgi:hypothetical protein
MCMTAKMSASMSWTASCPSAAAATPSTPRRAALCSCPGGARTGSGLPVVPARLLLIAVPGGIEDYFGEINAAASDAERRRIGKRYGIRVVPG